MELTCDPILVILIVTLVVLFHQKVASMSKATDSLTDAVSKLTEQVTAAVGRISNPPVTSDPATDAAVLKAVGDINAATASLSAALNPPAEAPPAS